mmetsp:Transcript_85319/g.268928  ORF Transcript_85319/g.268928 Transcript_85319/m.268928 type:complete len:260 (-) Transcript_85319:583-1362(-)
MTHSAAGVGAAVLELQRGLILDIAVGDGPVVAELLGRRVLEDHVAALRLQAHHGASAEEPLGGVPPDQFVLGHASAWTLDRDGRVCHVQDDLDVEVELGLDLLRVSDGLVPGLVGYVGGVGDQFPVGGLLVGVEGVDGDGHVGAARLVAVDEDAPDAPRAADAVRGVVEEAHILRGEAYVADGRMQPGPSCAVLPPRKWKRQIVVKVLSVGLEMAGFSTDRPRKPANFNFVSQIVFRPTMTRRTMGRMMYSSSLLAGSP